MRTIEQQRLFNSNQQKSFQMNQFNSNANSTENLNLVGRA